MSEEDEEGNGKAEICIVCIITLVFAIGLMAAFGLFDGQPIWSWFR